MNQAMSAWQSFGQPQQNTAKNNPYVAQPQQQTQQTGYRPQSNMSGTGYAPSKAATNYNTGAWGAGPQQTTAPQQPAQTSQTNQGAWTTGPSTQTQPTQPTTYTQPQPMAQIPATTGYNMGGIASQIDNILAYQERLKKLNDPRHAGRIAMANVGSTRFGGPSGAVGRQKSEAQRMLDSSKGYVDKELQKALDFYGGDKQRAMSALLESYEAKYNPNAGYNQRFNDEGEMDYLREMLKQMWGG